MASFLELLKQIFQDFGIADVFDILVVALGIFFLLRLVRGTRAVQLIKGFVVVMLLVAGAKFLSLKTTHWVLNVILQNWVITLIVLFQPELRLVIEQLGRGKFLREAFRPAPSQDIVTIINEVVRAARRLSEKKIGALIAIEREVGLNDIISTGRRIGGAVSSELLQTVFQPGGPMHDGGVVISHFQVAAAMCLFPLTSRDDSPRSYGTRHRAAIGLSEVTDAVIVVVSEETGAVSLAVENELISNLSVGALKEKLLALLQPASTEGNRPFWRRDPARKTSEGESVTTGSGEAPR